MTTSRTAPDGIPGPLRLQHEALNQRDEALRKLDAAVLSGAALSGSLLQRAEKAERDLAAANARVAELEARIRELETPMSWKNERDAANARAEAAERENAALDAAHRRMLDERNALRADLTRKQALLDRLKPLAVRARDEQDALESQLAVANALLRRAYPWEPGVGVEIETHLSGQAPARPEARK